jgi:hypothetical protein
MGSVPSQLAIPPGPLVASCAGSFENRWRYSRGGARAHAVRRSQIDSGSAPTRTWRHDLDRDRAELPVNHRQLPHLKIAHCTEACIPTA